MFLKNEFCQQAFKNAKLYKEKIKFWHDKKILKGEFILEQKVLLYNLRLKLSLQLKAKAFPTETLIKMV